MKTIELLKLSGILNEGNSYSINPNDTVIILKKEDGSYRLLSINDRDGKNITTSPIISLKLKNNDNICVIITRSNSTYSFHVSSVSEVNGEKNNIVQNLKNISKELDNKNLNIGYSNSNKKVYNINYEDDDVLIHGKNGVYYLEVRSSVREKNVQQTSTLVNLKMENDKCSAETQNSIYNFPVISVVRINGKKENIPEKLKNIVLELSGKMVEKNDKVEKTIEFIQGSMDYILHFGKNLFSNNQAVKNFSSLIKHEITEEEKSKIIKTLNDSEEVKSSFRKNIEKAKKYLEKDKNNIPDIDNLDTKDKEQVKIFFSTCLIAILLTL